MAIADIKSRVLDAWRLHPAETSFLAIAIIFGLLFMLIVPPTQAADETTHMYRAYQLSEGHILSQGQYGGYGDVMPADVYSDSRKLFADIPSHYERTFNYRQLPGLLRHKLDFTNRTFVHIEGSSVYSPVPYIPQVAAISVTKLIWPSITLMYYAARLANLLVWILLMYLAIRIWPLNKWAVFCLALMPMSLSQAATASPDALGNSLAFLLISLAVYWAHNKVKMTWREICILATGVILLSLTKPVFFCLGLLVFLFKPKQLGGTWKKYGAISAAVLFSGLLVTILWNLQVKDYSAGIERYYYGNFHINQHDQLLHMIRYPLGFIHTLFNSYLTSVGDVVARSFVGRLGWVDVDLPLWLLFSFYSLILLSLVGRHNKEKRYASQIRYVSLGLFILGFLATSAILYMTISNVGDLVINNIQGRYFIAFTPLLIPFFSGLLVIQDWQNIARKLFPLAYSGMLVITLFIVVNRFI